MQTAEEKAAEFIEQGGLNQRLTPLDVRNAIAALLKEQDRDTRHACAEAVSNADMMDDTWIHCDVADSLIINTKAV